MPESDYYWNVTVGSNDCSNQKCIKLPVLLDYLQEAAWHNATQLGFSTLDLMKNGITWVMNRMQVKVHQMPGHNQKLKIETWPASMDKYYTKRDFRVYAGDKVLVESASNWLVMDIAERKLIAIPDYIKDAGFVVDRNNLEAISGKLTYDDTKSERSTNLQVSWFDLDINDHVNNTKIYQWILEGLGSDFLNTHELTFIDILFKHEIKQNDQLISRSYYDEAADKWKHALINADNSMVHAVAETTFRLL